jgi:hypothetical protein
MSDGMDDDLGRKAMTLSTDNLTLRLRGKTGNNTFDKKSADG